MEYQNPKIPEGINVSKEHPLKEFLWLTLGVLAIAVLLILLLSFSAQWIAAKIPFSYEQKLAAHFLTQDQPPTPFENYLQSLADRLMAVQPMQESIKVTIHYVDEDIVNAYANLGGHIVLYRGLLEKIHDENTLAMLIAHEIAHVVHRDPITSLGRGVVVGLALAALAGVSGDYIAGNFLSNLSLLTILRFSRTQEQRADSTALQALQALYGHVGGATHLFEVLLEEASSSIRPPQFLSTHPFSATRIQALEQQAQQHGWPLQGTLTPLTHAIK